MYKEGAFSERGSLYFLGGGSRSYGIKARAGSAAGRPAWSAARKGSKILPKVMAPRLGTLASAPYTHAHITHHTCQWDNKMSNERSDGKGAHAVVQRPADGQQLAEGKGVGEGWKSPTNLGVEVQIEFR